MINFKTLENVEENIVDLDKLQCHEKFQYKNR